MDSNDDKNKLDTKSFRMISDGSTQSVDAARSSDASATTQVV